DHIYQDPHDTDYRFRLWYGDLSDGGTVLKLLATIRPDEVYHLGAQSHVRVSFDMPEYTADTCALGTLRILEAIRHLKLPCRFYQASSAEMYGASPPMQDEQTPFRPRSPYAAAKVFAHHMTVNYREAYGIFACSGILFNHESSRRGETFVTRKISRAVARIIAGKQRELYLGNLDAKRDWGYAPEYVEAMWQMLQQDHPDDYVIATGETHSVREFAQEAFTLVGLDWERYVALDRRYERPTEVEHLCGNAAKARTALGWTPRVRFRDLVRIMVIEDLKREQLDPMRFGLPQQHALAAPFDQRAANVVGVH
ncbi:GDP-mannose 4,6-dehydratase, partial [Candidatus Uhrbacteria bacterium]|nr:GDP-mannose 4,6-dehydratase [Candidatus Uhrbacteria bacterium]